MRWLNTYSKVHVFPLEGGRMKILISCVPIMFPMMCLKFPIAHHFISYPLPKVLPAHLCRWAKGQALYPCIETPILGSLPSFKFPNQNCPLEKRKKKTTMRVTPSNEYEGRGEYRPFRDLRSVPEAGRPREQVENHRPRAQISNHGRACTQVLLLYIFTWALPWASCLRERPTSTKKNPWDEYFAQVWKNQVAGILPGTAKRGGMWYLLLLIGYGMGLVGWAFHSVGLHQGSLPKCNWFFLHSFTSQQAPMCYRIFSNLD